MLTEGNWRVLTSHVLRNLLHEKCGTEDRSDVGMLGARLVSRVEVIEFLGALRAPLIDGDKSIFKNFARINLNKATITLICDTTTVVSLSNKILNSLPINLVSLFVIANEATLTGYAAHVVCDSVLADRIVRVVKGIAYVPTKGLELFALNQNRMEP